MRPDCPAKRFARKKNHNRQPGGAPLPQRASIVQCGPPNSDIAQHKEATSYEGQVDSEGQCVDLVCGRKCSVPNRLTPALSASPKTALWLGSRLLHHIAQTTEASDLSSARTVPGLSLFVMTVRDSKVIAQPSSDVMFSSRLSNTFSFRWQSACLLRFLNYVQGILAVRKERGCELSWRTAR
jgi:hypothetical protein